MNELSPEFNIDKKKTAVSLSGKILTIVFLKRESNLTDPTNEVPHFVEHSEVVT